MRQVNRASIRMLTLDAPRRLLPRCPVSHLVGLAISPSPLCSIQSRRSSKLLHRSAAGSAPHRSLDDAVQRYDTRTAVLMCRQCRSAPYILEAICSNKVPIIVPPIPIHPTNHPALHQPDRLSLWPPPQSSFKIQTPPGFERFNRQSGASANTVTYNLASLRAPSPPAKHLFFRKTPFPASRRVPTSASLFRDHV
jgi:hypothetical protein